jgi:hypothetical protein
VTGGGTTIQKVVGGWDGNLDREVQGFRRFRRFRRFKQELFGFGLQAFGSRQIFEYPIAQTPKPRA